VKEVDDDDDEVVVCSGAMPKTNRDVKNVFQKTVLFFTRFHVEK